MSFPLVWVIGAGGLLGSALLRELGADGFRSSGPLTWADGDALRGDLGRALHAFSERLATQPGRPWAVAWCAGLGVVGTSARALQAETATLRLFLELLSAERQLQAAPGGVLLASSAGGVYAGSQSSPISEGTPPEPSSDYGREKLAQEQLLTAWANALDGRVSTLVARVSNVYGPGQRLEKQQGLISHLARCSIHDLPVHIYVSLDTIRDYLFADDAARRLRDGIGRLLGEAPATGLQVTKIYASESEISIAGLLGIFREIAERPLRVVFGLHPVAAMQPARLQFRSRVWVPETGRQLDLAQGIAEVYRQQLALFARGQLPRPPLPTPG